MSTIERVTTVRLAEHPNLCHVLLRTDDGHTGLGETFFGARAVAAYLHESVAPYLLGQDPTRIDAHEVGLRPYVGSRGAGVETRGNSAVNIALYDLAGKIAGVPVHQLLGGLTRPRVRVYNTCAGYTYVRQARGQSTRNWGLPSSGSAGSAASAGSGGPDGSTTGSTAGSVGPYEDLEAFLHRADELARSLLAEGVTGMKIWPFDEYAERSGGTHIDAADLQRGLEPFRKIRAAVGDQIDIMVELHGLWNLPTAKRIARALEEFTPYWIEDPIRGDDVEAVADLARETPIPVTLSETLTGRAAFDALLRRRAVDVVMADVSWVGGLGEARRVAAMAEAASLPVTFHDCTGPVVLAASTHLACAAPNTVVQEMVRAFYHGWYADLVTALPPVSDGTIAPPPGPGLGLELRPELLAADGVFVRHSERTDDGRVVETAGPARADR